MNNKIPLGTGPVRMLFFDQEGKPIEIHLFDVENGVVISPAENSKEIIVKAKWKEYDNEPACFVCEIDKVHPEVAKSPYQKIKEFFLGVKANDKEEN